MGINLNNGELMYVAQDKNSVPVGLETFFRHLAGNNVTMKQTYKTECFIHNKLFCLYIHNAQTFNFADQPYFDPHSKALHRCQINNVSDEALVMKVLNSCLSRVKLLATNYTLYKSVNTVHV